MNAQEELQLQEHLQALGKILVRNTPQEQLKDFEAIELAVKCATIFKAPLCLSQWCYSARRSFAGRLSIYTYCIGGMLPIISYFRDNSVFLNFKWILCIFY